MYSLFEYDKYVRKKPKNGKRRKDRRNEVETMSIKIKDIAIIYHIAEMKKAGKKTNIKIRRE